MNVIELIEASAKRLSDAGERLPEAVVLFSPALDMTGGSASLLGNSERDAMFRGDALGALAEAYLQARFGKDLVDHYTYAFVGDGCLQEGVGQEMISLAGHLRPWRPMRRPSRLL